MQDTENAPRRSGTPNGRQAETIAAEQLIPRLHCIINAGGIQASRHRTIFERHNLYGTAKREFCTLQSQQRAPCMYDFFIKALTEALWL